MFSQPCALAGAAAPLLRFTPALHASCHLEKSLWSVSGTVTLRIASLWVQKIVAAAAQRAARAQRRPKQQLCRHEPACSVLLCPALTAARVVQHASMYPRTCSKDRLPLSQSMNTDGPASCGRGRPPAHAARHQAYAAGHPAHAALYQARADRHQACTAQHQARKAQHQACTARHQAYGPTSSTRGPTSSCPASSSRGPG